ncbi:MAG: hypothetical protein HN509_10505 [Halobacteriovoraceae bacterium]|jgi:hypothetical protein|nr:hypothetical protein [Halobacteriovoraceae bacterium]
MQKWIVLISHFLKKALRKPFGSDSYYSSQESFLYLYNLSDEVAGPVASAAYQMFFVSSVTELDQALEGKKLEDAVFEKYMRLNIGKNSQVLLIFKGADLAHYSWVARGWNAYIFDEYFSEIDFKQEAHVGPCVTYKEFRGEGLYPIALTEICRKLKEEALLSKISIRTLTTNTPSIKGVCKSPFNLVGKLLESNMFFMSFFKVQPQSQIE